MSLTKTELSALLKPYNIKVTGSKAELLSRYERLQSHTCELTDFRYKNVSEKYKEEIASEVVLGIEVVQAIEVIKGIEVVQATLYKEEVHEDCCICMDEITKELEETKCGHKFHKGCIEEWFKNCSKCPICREEVYEKVVKQRIQEYYYENMLEEYGLVTEDEYETESESEYDDSDDEDYEDSDPDFEFTMSDLKIICPGCCNEIDDDDSDIHFAASDLIFHRRCWEVQED